MKSQNTNWKDPIQRGRNISASKRGIPQTEAHRKAIAKSKEGSKSHFWKGGVTSKSRVARNSVEYKLWRTNVFRRDDYTCQACGSRGIYLQADHVLSFSNYPDLRFEILNGRTLCIPCHKETPNYAGRIHLTDY